MTDQTLRAKIARALYDSATAKARKESAHVAAFEDAAGYFRATLTDQADAVLAVLDLDKVRAEAQVEALREVAQDAEWSDVALPGMTAKDVIRGVRARADRIARVAGIETGEEATDE